MKPCEEDWDVGAEQGGGAAHEDGRRREDVYCSVQVTQKSRGKKPRNVNDAE